MQLLYSSIPLLWNASEAWNCLVVIFHYKIHLWNGGQFNYAVEFMLGLTLRLIDSKTANYSKVIFRYKIYLYGMVANSITYANSYWCQSYILYTGNAIWQLYITKPLWCKNRNWSFERELQNKSNSTHFALHIYL